MKKGVLGLASFMAIIASATAASALAIPEPMQNIFKYVFIDLAKLGMGSDSTAIITFKFILWILAFTLVYFGLDKSGVFGEKKNIKVVIAIILALMTTIMLPGTLVITLFNTYALIGGIVLISLPLIFGFWIGHQWFNKPTAFAFFLRGVIFFLMAWVLGSLMAAMLATQQPAYVNLYTWGTLGSFFCIVAGIIYWIFAATSGKIKNIDNIIDKEDKKEEKEAREIKEKADKNENIINVITSATAKAEQSSKELAQMLNNFFNQIQNVLININTRGGGTGGGGSGGGTGGGITQNQATAAAQIQQFFGPIPGKMKEVEEETNKTIKNYEEINENITHIKKNVEEETKSSKFISEEISKLEAKIQKIENLTVRDELLEIIKNIREENKIKIDESTILSGDLKELENRIKGLEQSMSELETLIAQIKKDLKPLEDFAKIQSPSAKDMLNNSQMFINVSKKAGDIVNKAQKMSAEINAINSTIVLIQGSTGFKNIGNQAQKIMQDVSKIEGYFESFKKKADDAQNQQKNGEKIRNTIITAFTNLKTLIVKQQGDLAALDRKIWTSAREHLGQYLTPLISDSTSVMNKINKKENKGCVLNILEENASIHKTIFGNDGGLSTLRSILESIVNQERQLNQYLTDEITSYDRAQGDKTQYLNATMPAVKQKVNEKMKLIVQESTNLQFPLRGPLQA